jgi:molecular chaperone HscA
MLKEQQVEGRRVIEAIDAAMAQDGHILSEQERAHIGECRDELESSLEDADAEQLKKLIAKLEEASESYVARRMDESVRKVLGGKQINEVDVR